jgi:hypothetical protein
MKAIRSISLEPRADRYGEAASRQAERRLAASEKRGCRGVQGGVPPAL